MSLNAYEIRTEVLRMAKDLALEEYHSKYHLWEETTKRDESAKPISVTDAPTFPTLDTVLVTAEKMYRFVENHK